MTNIVDIMREQMNQPLPPTPTEKAQIVIVFKSPIQPAIVRFNSVKKAEKAYEAIAKAWGAQSQGLLHDIGGDMFICTVNLEHVAYIAYADHAKRAKFVPIP